MDKEYIILNEVSKNGELTQRALSRKANLSLGSVNILLNRMIQAGWIKIRNIPANRVAYILTPKGMAEKLRKTSAYIITQYKYISDTIVALRTYIHEMTEVYERLYFLVSSDDVATLIREAIGPEMSSGKYVLIMKGQYEHLAHKGSNSLAGDVPVVQDVICRKGCFVATCMEDYLLFHPVYESTVHLFEGV